MTAIYGLWRPAAGSIETDFNHLGAALLRYGPHGSESWIGDVVAIGKHRWHILAEDEWDRQPTRGRRYVVASDVRLTERDALISELELGERGSSLSDDAIVAEAIERWHESAFDKIYGPFAIAAWDLEEKRLLLARDPTGERPLFFAASKCGYAFASMPVPLQSLPDIPKNYDLLEMKRFLRYLPLTPGRSYYEGIDQVIAGHCAAIDATGVSQVRHWNPDLTPLKLRTHADYVSELRKTFDHAVYVSLRGVDSAVASQLSGGFDSTAVTVTAAIEMAKRGGKVVAITSVPGEHYKPLDLKHRFGDEGPMAAQTAAMHPNIEHLLLQPDRLLLSNIDRTSAAFGQPMLNLCNQTWSDAINDAAKNLGLTIMLSGSMGNATISESGVLALADLVRQRRPFIWWRIARGLVKTGWMRWRGVLWNSISPWMPTSLWKWLETRTDREPILLRNASMLRDEHWQTATQSGAGDKQDHAIDRTITHEWERDQETSVEARLEMMRMDDFGPSNKASLAEWGLDLRDPTAERRLMEFALRVPVEELIHRGQPRSMLREILASRVPAAILANRKKGYQAADWYERVVESRQALLEELERIEMYDATRNLYDIERMRSLLENMPPADSPVWGDFKVTNDYRHALLRAVSVANFMRKASGSNY